MWNPRGYGQTARGSQNENLPEPRPPAARSGREPWGPRLRTKPQGTPGDRADRGENRAPAPGRRSCPSTLLRTAQVFAAQLGTHRTTRRKPGAFPHLAVLGRPCPAPGSPRRAPSPDPDTYKGSCAARPAADSGRLQPPPEPRIHLPQNCPHPRPTPRRAHPAPSPAADSGSRFPAASSSSDLFLPVLPLT